MATIRPFSIFDTLTFNNINLDLLTETVIFLKIFLIFKMEHIFFSLTLCSMVNTSPNGLNIA
jgi:hypothetical protein